MAPNHGPLSLASAAAVMVLALIHPFPTQALVAIPAADYEWLNATTVDFLARCQLAGADGVTIFTPDASSSYGAQWTRDFAMAVLNAPRALKATEAATGASVGRAVAYTFERIDPATGMVPDRVTSEGEAVFAPGSSGTWPITLAWDNMPFAALLLAGYAKGWSEEGDGAQVFCEWEPAARKALDFVPLEGGLAFNDPQAPNCSFGFEDSVVLPGRQLTVSLLLYDASQRMSEMATVHGCGEAGHYASLAKGVAQAVDDLFDETSGLFLASDDLETLPDVFGSAYAVKLGLSSVERRQSVGAFLGSQWREYSEEVAAARHSISSSNRSSSSATGGTAGVSGGVVTNSTTIWQQGQARHLPQPLYWVQCWDETWRNPSGCPPPGTYQNGAFWATPLNWILPALEASGFAAEASEVAQAVLASFRGPSGVSEALNTDVGYVGVLNYVASATNVLGAVEPAAASD